MANEVALPPHSLPNSPAAAAPNSAAAAAPPNSAAAAAPNSPAAIAATAESMKKCKSVFRSLQKYQNAKLLHELGEHSVDLKRISNKLHANSYWEPRDFERDFRSVLDFGAKSSDKNVRAVSGKLLEKFEMVIRPIISEWDVYYRRSLEIEGAIDDHVLNEFNNTAPKQTKSCTAMAAAPNSLEAIAAMAESMEKCNSVFQSLRKYKNAKLLNVIEEHSVDLNTIDSKLEAKSYSEPRDFGRDVRSVLEFGKKSLERDVRDVAEELLAKLEMDIGPIISEWDVYYWGSLEIEGAIDEHELNELVGRIRINSEHLMTDAEIAGFEATLQYYQPASHTHGASTSTDPPNKRRKLS